MTFYPIYAIVLLNDSATTREKKKMAKIPDPKWKAIFASKWFRFLVKWLLILVLVLLAFKGFASFWGSNKCVKQKPKVVLKTKVKRILIPGKTSVVKVPGPVVIKSHGDSRLRRDLAKAAKEGLKPFKQMRKELKALYR